MTPALRLLRQSFPSAWIDVVVRSGCEAVLEGNPDVSQVIPTAPPKGARRSGLQSLRALRTVLGRRYEYAFDLSNSDRAKVLVLASGARVRAINDWGARLGWRRHIFNRVTHFAWGPEHQVLRDFRAVADAIGAAAPPGPLALDTDVALEGVPQGPYAVIHPVSRWAYKQWLPERWAAVADALPLQVVFTWGPGEAPEVDRILSHSKKTHLKANPMSLRQLGKLIRGAKLFLGVDTVAMHVAAAVQTPAVALFGPSSEWSWRPWQSPHQLVLGECPCKATRNFTCDKRAIYPCMERITVDDVSRAAAKLLATTKATSA